MTTELCLLSSNNINCAERIIMLTDWWHGVRSSMDWSDSMGINCDIWKRWVLIFTNWKVDKSTLQPRHTSCMEHEHFSIYGIFLFVCCSSRIKSHPSILVVVRQSYIPSATAKKTHISIWIEYAIWSIYPPVSWDTLSDKLMQCLCVCVWVSRTWIRYLNFDFGAANLISVCTMLNGRGLKVVGASINEWSMHVYCVWMLAEWFDGNVGLLLQHCSYRRPW